MSENLRFYLIGFLTSILSDKLTKKQIQTKIGELLLFLTFFDPINELHLSSMDLIENKGIDVDKIIDKLADNSDLTHFKNFDAQNCDEIQELRRILWDTRGAQELLNMISGYLNVLLDEKTPCKKCDVMKELIVYLFTMGGNIDMSEREIMEEIQGLILYKKEEIITADNET